MKTTTEVVGLSLLIGTVTLAVLIVSLKIHDSDKRLQATRILEQQSCTDLNLRFGDRVVVNGGFYDGVLFQAVGPGYDNRFVYVKYYLSETSEKLEFRCSDLVRSF